MPTISTTVECDVYDSFRVQQVAGMFDLPIAARAGETFTAELPGLDEDWTIGALVGPSGSGKSTLARHAYGDAVWRPGVWPEDRAVIDGFGELPIKDITQALTAVGLSSPPSWIKPYRVLSGGERFRCDLAKALLGNAECGLRNAESKAVIPHSEFRTPHSNLVVFDEFTSVVDRTVARIGSAAVAKAIRSGRIDRRFVAVTCHYDVLEWLEVDWHLDLADGRLHRRRLRRPEIRLTVQPCDRAVWRQFARHHYLSSGLAAASVCYAARLRDGDAPVAFCSVSNLFGGKGRRRISRIVVLPDYQGVGIGARLLDAVAAHHTSLGQTIRITTSHPAMLAYLQRSPHWRAVHVYPNTRRRKRVIAGRRVKDAAGRCVASFEFVREPEKP
ncbi:MAG: GNAT family N-acetyltransferase [Planctomycetes bacterium]|nr:GNAT family N-acetyltransferase [Planctomycetota bacterium]